MGNARAILCVGLAAALSAIRWDPSLRQYVDEAGRARLFHGVNVVYKKEPWYPPYFPIDSDKSLGDADMKDLQVWGHNVVRLGVMWPGVEPRPGYIDQDYLKRMKEIVDKLSEYGIYSIIDLHQDVGSRRFCGEGVPEHYVDAMLQNKTSRLSRAQAFPMPRYPQMNVNNDTGYPSLEDCLKNNFGDYYDSEQVGALFIELYTPGTALNQGFLQYWDVVSQTFNDSTAVLAYELLNEPPTECLTDPTDCRNDKYPYRIGHKQEDKYLVPLYQAAAARIRKNDQRHMILYESTFYPKMFDTAAFGAPPLGSDPAQGLSYHIYCPIGWVAEDTSCRMVQALYEHQFHPFLEKNAGVAGFMTEFGAISGSSQDLVQVDRLLNWADSNFQSWAYWQYKFYHDYTTMNQNEAFYDRNGDLEAEKVKTLSRTYAQAIAGRPVHMAFDTKKSRFDLEYTPNPNITKNTEIYMNANLHYPHGYKVDLKPSGCWVTSLVGSTLEVIAQPSKGSDCKGNVKLTLTPTSHAEDVSEIVV
jgi:endoglycosylceramidase